MERKGAVVVLIMLAFLVALAASSKCCYDHHSWGSDNQITGCSSDQSDDCNSWCQNSCRGGECKFRSGQHKCHCYC
ncbi:hypothetical protein BDA96_05G083000 [Sorghum bicolor]|uniref:Knottin scorpion toxin-like domain-containing protein n=2 Tax=Sorghum bicolor TaxID=4558 RepID=C5Y7B3_SORBI|nr:hypothetical protein SORBI_3005G082000 [Sorghum bicolor]KAG0529260.1 hypothetical protein BDA96_05G083000 [Sorghum bicolor]